MSKNREYLFKAVEETNEESSEVEKVLEEADSTLVKADKALRLFDEEQGNE